MEDGRMVPAAESSEKTPLNELVFVFGLMILVCSE